MNEGLRDLGCPACTPLIMGDVSLRTSHSDTPGALL